MREFVWAQVDHTHRLPRRKMLRRHPANKGIASTLPAAGDAWIGLLEVRVFYRMAPFARAFTLALGAALTLLGWNVLTRRAEKPGLAEAAFFNGKNVVITGGSRGLGFVLAGMLLDAGANVTICGRSERSIDAALQKLEPFATACAGVVCDVRDRAACERLIQAAHDRFGDVDVLINNAGIIEVGPFADQTIDNFTVAMDTHFWAALYTALAVLPSMRARRTGHIVNIASIGGVVGVPHLAPYSTSKFAQIGFTQALAAEVAADGVKVISIVPGLMLTGSPDHARFKGRHRAEYAWFALSDANPLLSVSAERAARRVLRATRRGEAQAVIGLTAQAAKTLNALAPKTTAFLLRLAAGMLPASGGIATGSRSGAESHSHWTQNIFMVLNRAAMRNANQAPGASQQSPPSSP